MSEPNYRVAIDEWRIFLGKDQVITERTELVSASLDTGPLARRIPLILRPKCEKDVIALLRTAESHRVPIFPVSTGRNWGYGTSNPVRDGCALVELSGMNRILEFDQELGLVTLEPGVTQRQLRDYLEQRGLDFLVPVTGAGPDCSLIGNALERGYGITPVADHFTAVTRIRAILADGSVYDSPLSELGGELIDRGFKWGVGPYIDGIFTQGNVGIVTSMTIALAPRPENIVGFFFGISAEDRLEDAVAAIRHILRQTNGATGSINLMNQRRVLSMIEPYPKELPSGHLIPDDALAAMAKRNQIMTWTGAGAIYGERGMVNAAKRIVKKELKGIANRLVFFTPATSQRLFRWSNKVPGKLGVQAQNIFGTLEKTMSLLAGAPSEIAMPLSYWKSGTLPTPGNSFNPARDGCGLYWYSPLVPMVPAKVRQYTTMVDRVCRENQIEPLITLTSLSDKCWDSTVPILFDPKDAQDTNRAKTCHRSLFEAGRQAGFVPYRSHIDTMDWFVDSDSGFWQTAAKIKDALDPYGIIAPGRYSLR